MRNRRCGSVRWSTVDHHAEVSRSSNAFAPIVVVLALSSGLVACGEEEEAPDSGDTGAQTTEPTDYTCTITVKAIELVSSRFRPGNGFRQMIEEVGPALGPGCDTVVATLDKSPQKSLPLTIENPDGSTTTLEVTGSALTPVGSVDCTTWIDNKLLYDACVSSQ